MGLTISYTPQNWAAFDQAICMLLQRAIRESFFYPGNTYPQSIALDNSKQLQEYGFPYHNRL